MQLYGRQWKRRELEERVGRIEQIGGIQRFTMNEGPEAGVETIRVRTGSGLSYWVTPTKGLDISLTEMHGVPVSWLANTGEPHPAHYDATGAEWLRTASGGLLMTCGLTQVGSPGADDYGAYGLHGRIHHTPARQISTWSEWTDDEYGMMIRGVMEEASIFGSVLRLTRTITSRLGENRITIEDTVENAGFREAPHMMLYHFNFGFPLMSEDTTIMFPQGNVLPRDPDMTMDGRGEWQSPDPSFREQVYYYEPPARENPVMARIHCPSFPVAAYNARSSGMTVELEWDPTTLPRFVQWKMPGTGEYVLGLEPSNCWTRGREKENDNGTLRFLKPGESVNYRLELRFE